MDDTPYNTIGKEEDLPSQNDIKDYSYNKQNNNGGWDKHTETISSIQTIEDNHPPPPVANTVIDKPNIEVGEKHNYMYILPPPTPLVIHNYNNEDF